MTTNLEDESKLKGNLENKGNESTYTKLYAVCTRKCRESTRGRFISSYHCLKILDSELKGVIKKSNQNQKRVDYKILNQQAWCLYGWNLISKFMAWLENNLHFGTIMLEKDH